MIIIIGSVFWENIWVVICRCNFVNIVSGVVLEILWKSWVKFVWDM